MSKFIVGNRASKKRSYGPKIIKKGSRPGYYIRWYESREIIRDYLITAVTSPPASLELEPAKGKGLKVISSPGEDSAFHGLIEKGNIILKVAGKSVNTISELESALKEFSGQKVRVKVNASGKTGTRPKLIKAGKNKEEAQHTLMNLSAVMKQRVEKTPEIDITFTQLVDEFLDWASTPAAGYSKRWLNDITRIMEIHRKRWGTMLLSDITAAEIQRWVNKRSKEAASSTLVNEISPLRQAFKLAINQYKYIKEDPTRGITFRQEAKKIPKYLSPEEINVLLQIARAKDDSRLNPDVKSKVGRTKTTLGQKPDELKRTRYNKDGTFDTARIRFLLLTALRKSQLIDLQWSDYDSKRGTITLQTSDTHSEKSRRVNVIPLPEKAKAIIDGQPRNSDYIFPNLAGGHDVQIATRLGRIFKKFEEQTGRHMHLHMLRHTALTSLLEHTQNIAAVSRFAGHADIKTTEIYAHILDGQLKKITADFDCTA